MNLRFPIVVAVVGVAAGAAALRALQPHPAVPTLAVVAPSPAADAVAAGGRPRRSGFAGARAAPSTIVVYVAGEVRRPGVYTLAASARGADALRAGGGPAPDADLVAVNLAARLADGDEIAVPARGAAARQSARTRAAGGATSEPRARHARKRKRRRSRARPDSSSDAASERTNKAPVPTDLVDLNAADVDALETLPGIGPALAQRIVTVRDQSGPFGSLDDLLDIGGMSQSELDEIAPYVTVR